MVGRLLDVLSFWVSAYFQIPAVSFLGSIWNFSLRNHRFLPRSSRSSAPSRGVRDLRLGFFRVAVGRRWHDDEDDEDEYSRMRKMIINDKHCGGNGEEDYHDNGEEHNDGDTKIVFSHVRWKMFLSYPFFRFQAELFCNHQPVTWTIIFLEWFYPKVVWGKIYTLPETEIAPEKLPSQKETSIPTIHFQVQAVSFREGMFFHLWLFSSHRSSAILTSDDDRQALWIRSLAAWWVMKIMYTPVNSQLAGWKMDPDWVDVFPIENGDTPACYVSLPKGIYGTLVCIPTLILQKSNPFMVGRYTRSHWILWDIKDLWLRFWWSRSMSAWGHLS